MSVTPFNVPTDISALTDEQATEILDYKVIYSPISPMDKHGYYIVDLYSDIDTDVLVSAVDGWYSDRDDWCLSIATTTRKQPLYGLLQIRDSWEAAMSDRIFEVYNEDGDIDEDVDQLTYADVYGELVKSVDAIFTALGLSEDVMREFEEHFTIRCDSGEVTAY